MLTLLIALFERTTSKDSLLPNHCRFVRRTTRATRVPYVLTEMRPTTMGLVMFNMSAPVGPHSYQKTLRDGQFPSSVTLSCLT